MRKTKRWLAGFLSICLLMNTPVISANAAVISEISVNEIFVSDVSANEVSQSDIPEGVVSEDEGAECAVPQDEVQAEQMGPQTLTRVFVNPLYEDQVSEDTLDQWAEEVEKNAQKNAQTSTTSSVTMASAVTSEEAEDVILDTMVARQSTLTVAVVLPEMPDDVGGYGMELIQKAYADDPTAAADEGDYLRYHYYGGGVRASWYPGSEKVTITYQYTFNYLSTAEQEQAVTAKLSEVYAELNLGVTSGEGKIGKIYDYITNRVTYDYEHVDQGASVYPTAWTAYGGLIDGTCVCQGYSTLTYRMMKESGVPVRIISGDAGGGHAWNIVAIDGLYYNIDSTWDGYTVYADGSVASAGKRNWYLLSMEDFTRHTRDEEYLTDEFQAAHPMATQSYSEATGNPDKVTLSQTTASLFTYQEVTLTATVTPVTEGDAVDQTVIWTSSDKSVATVVNGKITGIKPGTAIVTATSAKDSTKQATCVVTVKSDYTIAYELNGGTLEKANPTAYNPYYPALALNAPVKEEYGFVGWYRDADFAEDTRMENIPTGSDYGNITLYAKWFECVAPTISNAEAGLEGVKLTWSALDQADKYYVYRKAATEENYTQIGQTAETVYLDKLTRGGTYYYVLTAEYDGIESGYSEAKEVKYELGVVREVALSQTTASLFTYQETTLSATVVPVMEGDTVDQTVTWASSDESVVTVADGKLTGVKPGTATITATFVKDTTKQATCAVTVKDDYTIAYELNGGTLETANPTAYNPYYPELALNAPVKTDCTFLGWYRDAEFAEDTRMENIPAGSDYGNLTLYAKWKEKAIVATPAASIPSGEVEKGTKLKLSCETLDAKIYYTVDGTNPDRSSQQYTDVITIDSAMEIRAYAVKDGFKDSEVAVFSYTVKDTSADLGDVLPEDVPADGIIPEGLWVAGVEDAVYTGKAITFDLRVYHGKKLLTLKTDYTVSYKNNKVAAEATAKKAPSVTVTGKGNYKDKIVETFNIEPLSIRGTEFTVEDVAVVYNGKTQKPVPVLYKDGAKLKAKKDYTVSYPDTSEGAYTEPGTYAIILEGTGNYCKNIETTVTIAKATLMSKTKISAIPAQPYNDGDEIKPAIVVKNGKDIVDDTMYSVTYLRNREVGTATVRVEGDGVNYIGVKTATFKITGVAMSKVKVDGLVKSLPYTGKEATQDAVELTYTAKKGAEPEILEEGKHYEVTYTKNVNVGTATVTFKGKGKYTGSIKKTYKITAFDIKENQGGLFTADYVQSVPYAKGGSKPAIQLFFDGTELKEGKDYTLSYKNNKALNDGSNSKKLATIVVKGKGNFKNTASYTFTITKQDIALLNVQVADKLVSNKANAYKSTPKVYDVDGKALKAGTDYEKAVVYRYDEDTYLADGTFRQADEIIGSKDVLLAGTVVRVEITGKGNYEANVVCGRYRIVNADISKATVKVDAQVYTGSAVEPSKDQIHITLKGEDVADTDYEIVSYSNNIRKGTATMVIRGVGQYGGTKTVKFTIGAKTVKDTKFLK